MMQKLERYTKLVEDNVTKDIELVQENIENENTNSNVSNSNLESSTTIVTETVNIDNRENIENTSLHAVTDSPALQEATITNVPDNSSRSQPNAKGAFLNKRCKGSQNWME